MTQRLGRSLLVAACAALAPHASAATVGMGTVWTTTDQAGTNNDGAGGLGFWAPNNQGSVTGFSFAPSVANLTNDGTSVSTGTFYLQNIVLANPTSGTATAAYITVIDTSTNTVVGASTNTVTLAVNNTSTPTDQRWAAGTPWRFNSLALDATKRYAFVFTSTAGVANTTVSATPSDGGTVTGDIDPSVGGTLTVVNYRAGGGANNASNVIAGSGAFINSGTNANYEQWWSAGFTTTNQALTALDVATDTTRGTALTAATGLRKTGAGILTLNTSFAHAITGDIFVEEGGVRITTASNGTTTGVLGASSGDIFLSNANPPGGTATTQNSVTMSGASLIVNTGANNATLNSVVEGAGRLEKEGAGTLTITSTNSFIGELRVLAGTVSVSTVSDIGASSNIGRGNASSDAIRLVGSTFRYTGAAGSTNRRFGIAPSGGTILNDGTGALQITGVGAIGSNGIGAGTTVRTLTLGGSYNGDPNVFGNTIVDYVAGTATNLAKSGAGIWALTAANTYTGTTTVSAGTLQVGNNGTTGQLGTGDVSLATGTALVFNRSGGTLAVANTITGVGTASVTKTGAGEMSLTGQVSVAGALTITQGKVAFNGLTSSGFGSVAVGASGTLSIGNVFANASVTVANLSGSGAVDTAWSGGNDTRTLVVNSTADTEFSGSLNNASTGSRVLALDKAGNGKLTLSGGGNFSGGTRLAAGTLNVTSNGALGGGALTAAGGTLSGTATLANPVILSSNLTATTNTTLTLNGGLSGASSLTKTGAGTLVLGGTIGNSGSIVVSTGRVRIATGATFTTPGIELANGAEFESVDGLTLGAGRSLSLGAGSAIATAAHIGDVTLSGGTINIDFGASTNDLLNVTGGLTLTSGSINFSKASTYASGYYAFASYSTSITGATSNITLSGLASDGTSRQTFELFDDTVNKQLQLKVGGQSQSVVWTAAGGGTWGAAAGSATNWQVADATYAPVDPDDSKRFYNGDSVTFDDGAASGNVALAASLVPVSVTFSGNTLDYVLTSSGGSLTGGSLTKSGTASLTVSLANSYSGATNLSNGRLRLGADGALGSGLLTVSGGRLSAVGADARAVSNNIRFTNDVQLGDTAEGGDTGELTLSGGVDLNAAANRTLTLLSDVKVSGAISNGSLTKAGSGKLTLSGANSLGVNLAVSAGTVALGASGVVGDTNTISLSSGATLDLAGFSEGLAALTVGNGATVTAGTLTSGAVTLDSGSTFSASLTGTTSLTKNNAGSLTLGSARTGSTTLNAGTTLVGNASALGSGTVTLGGGTLAMADATDRAIANALSIGGDVTLGSVGGGKFTFSGTVALGSGARTLTTVNDVVLSNVVSGAASLTKAGNGKLTLSNTNSYSGGTTVTGGTLELTHATNALSNTGAVTIAGGTVAYGANSDTIGALSLTSGALTGSGTLTVASASFDHAGNVSVAAILAGTGALTKAGAGTLALSATQAYTGATTISAGTLQIGDGSTAAGDIGTLGSAAGTATVTIESGATLRYYRTGTVSYTGAGAATYRLRNLAGAGTLVIEGSGTGSASVNPSLTFTVTPTVLSSGGTGYSEANSWSGFSGAIVVKGGAEFQTARNGTSSMGTATVTLGEAGASGSSGGLAQHSGNWSFTNNIVLAGPDNFIRNRSSSQAPRTMRLFGVISGAGKVTFDDPANVFTSADRGFMLLADNTMSGDVVINAHLRVGAVGTQDSRTLANSYYAGTTGSLGTAKVSVASGKILSFTRTNEHTVANEISGAGQVRIGSDSAEVILVNNDVVTVNHATLGNTYGQIVNLTGTNSYAGGTEIMRGTLNVGSLDNIGTGHLAVKGGTVVAQTGVFKYTGATATTNRKLWIDNGRATINVTRSDATLAFTDTTGAVGGATGHLFTKDGAGTLEIADDVTAGTNVAVTVAAGRLRLLGVNDYVGATTIASGATLEIGGTGTLALSAIAINGTLDLSTSVNTSLASLSGTGTLDKSGAGILTLSGTKTGFTGSVSVTKGKLILDSAVLGSSLALGTASDVSVEMLADSTVAGLSGGSGRTVTLAAGTLTVSPGSGLSTFAGSLAGVGHLTKSGNGTLVLGGANAHVDTSVTAGTLRLSGAGTLGTGAVSVSGTGILDLNDVAVSKDITLGGGKVVGASASSGTISVTGDAALGGTVGGTLALGTNGARVVTITDGLTVAGVLGGSGNFVGGNLDVMGTHTVGNSPGYQSVTGNLSYAGGSVFQWEVDNVSAWAFNLSPSRSSAATPGDFDAVDVIGNLTISPGAYLAVTSLAGYLDPFWNTPDNTMSFKVFDVTGEINGLFTFADNTQEFAVDNIGIWTIRRELAGETKGIYLTYTAVPEPSTYGLVLGGLALAVGAWRRRKAKQA